ncbi:hypothetical protein ACLHWY_27165 [Priestia aryabhattai]|uniref:hypothetical protein n=1 Tax=Priestia aryabhattai TaxID=412384 RepID=UPI0039832A1B
MAKYDISNELRQSVETDMANGIKWSHIAEEHGVDMGVIRSVHGSKLVRENVKKAEKGGTIRYWNGMRLTDGEPSPVKKYYISELENQK